MIFWLKFNLNSYFSDILFVLNNSTSIIKTIYYENKECCA